MESIRIFSAGSFRYALQELAEVFKQTYSVKIELILGPAGLLRQRIEQGETCDVFISANRNNIEILARNKRLYQQAVTAFNRLVLTTSNAVLFRNSVFKLLFDRTLRLATSTPVCDPCGDYTWQLFDKIETLFPTKGESLKQRALQLVGGDKPSVVPAGQIASHYLLSNGYADMMIGYAHYKTQSKTGEFLVYEFPPELEVKAEYVSALLNPTKSAIEFFQLLHSQRAKQVIQNHGFLPE